MPAAVCAWPGLKGRSIDLMPFTLTSDQQAIISTIREWVERRVIPTAPDLEHADEFPDALTAEMKELGLFGVTIGEEYGGLGLDLTTYALIQVELARGWMSLSGILNTHFISAWMIKTFGTEEQRTRYLPRMAAGELRAAYSMTEPEAGSDVQAIRTRAVRNDEGWTVTGQKMWTTNGLRAGMVMLLAKTNQDATPAHRGMTAFILEKEPGVSEQPGLTIPPPLRKLGYKGVESTELVFDGFRAPTDAVLGGDAGIGEGFKYFMAGVELGRVNVAARGVGIATSAFENAIRYAQERHTFGKPIAQHQAIQLKLADMATKIEASRLLMLSAAAKKDAGERADLEAGMAKLFATEAAHEVVTDALRIYGGYGYSLEYPIERLYRDTPLLIVGEGTSEIQRLIIARRLLEQYAI
jgi:alkylation response protein AidB-like acyl-CoA dehydrogenase